MTRRPLLGLLLLAAGLLLGAAGGAAPAVASDIRIGLAGPFSGPLARMGVLMRLGAEAAIRTVNSDGGIDGRRLTLVTADDGGDPRRATEAARALVAEDVVAVIGHFGSAASIPASFVYADAGIVQIAPAATSSDLTQQGFDLLFRVSGRDDQQGTLAGTWLARSYPGQKVAILNDDTAYGRALGRAAQVALRANGLLEALYETVPAGRPDHEELLARLAEMGIDAVYYGGLVEDGGRLLAEMREAGLIAQFVAGDAFADWRFWEVAGPSVIGAVVTTERPPVMTDAIRRLRASLGPEPPEGPELFTALYAHSAVELWAASARRAGTTEPWAVAHAMKRAGTVETVSGPVFFDLRGDRFPPVYALYRWRDDGWLGLIE